MPKMTIDVLQMLDIADPKIVQVQVSSDYKTLWVNVNGICRLRVNRAELLEVELEGITFKAKVSEESDNGA